MVRIAVLLLTLANMQKLQTQTKQNETRDGRMIGGIIVPNSYQSHYDFTHSRNPSGGRKRRQPKIETGEEETILRPHGRLQGVTLSRDMIRNNPQAHGIGRTLRVNIIGEYGKIQFKETEGWYAEAQKWFNSVWSKTADYLDNSSFRECLQLVVYALSYEGDFVAVFDDGLISGKRPGTGKFLFFEADQICNLCESDFGKFKAAGFSQNAGVISDSNGRHVGVIVSRKRGMTEVPLKSAFILSRDPDSPELVPWRHVRRKFRFRQSRGVADAIPSLQTIIDGYEMLGYEMQTAKAASARYATVIEAPDATTSPLPGGFEDLNLDDPEAVDNAVKASEEELKAEALERYTGGHADYVPHGTTIAWDPVNRPNTKLPEFLDFTTDVSGQAFGLGHAYSRMRADSSYTAFRGDMTMTWMSFRDSQQFIEDAFSDWAAECVIAFGVRTRAIPPPPDGWMASTAWQYPKMPSIDGQKEQSELSSKLKNGVTTFRDEIGPHWKQQMKQLSDELKFAKDLGLPLSVFETVAGAVAQETKQNEEK